MHYKIVADENSVSAEHRSYVPLLRHFKAEGPDAEEFIGLANAAAARCEADIYELRLRQAKIIAGPSNEHPGSVMEFYGALLQDPAQVGIQAERLPPERRALLEAQTAQRFRLMAAMKVRLNGDDIVIERTRAAKPLVQTGGARVIERSFAEVPQEFTGHPLFREWMRPLAVIVMQRAEIRDMFVRLHIITSDTNETPFTLPDSDYDDARHSDDARAVVSAFVTEFAGQGGVSRVYADAATRVYQARLGVGEGLLQTDHGKGEKPVLLHGITPVFGKRTILGLDLDPNQEP